MLPGKVYEDRGLVRWLVLNCGKSVGKLRAEEVWTQQMRVAWSLYLVNSFHLFELFSVEPYLFHLLFWNLRQLIPVGGLLRFNIVVRKVYVLLHSTLRINITLVSIRVRQKLRRFLVLLPKAHLILRLHNLLARNYSSTRQHLPTWSYRTCGLFLSKDHPHCVLSNLSRLSHFHLPQLNLRWFSALCI